VVFVVGVEGVQARFVGGEGLGADGEGGADGSCFGVVVGIEVGLAVVVGCPGEDGVGQGGGARGLGDAVVVEDAVLDVGGAVGVVGCGGELVRVPE
jgi:hypothetical protein